MDTFTRRRDENDTIRLDAEGNWYYGAYPVLHERTIQFLHKNIARSPEGRFYLTGEDKPVYFTVEDAPYQVLKVQRTIAGYLVTLTDENMDLLDDDSIWKGKKDEALYCLVKGGTMSAKFSRPAYYDIMKDLKQVGAKYQLAFGNQKYPIQDQPPKRFLDLEVEAARNAQSSKSKSKSKSVKKAPAKKAAAPKPAAPVKAKKAPAKKAKSAPKAAVKKKAAKPLKKAAKKKPKSKRR